MSARRRPASRISTPLHTSPAQLDRYIRRWAQKPAPEVEVVQHRTTETDNGPPSKADDNYKLVKDVMTSLCQCMTESSAKFRKFVVPFSAEDCGKRKGSSIKQLSSTSYDVGLVLVKPCPKGAFEAVLGPNEGIPRGEASIQLSSDLTREERGSLRHTWLPCLDSEDQLCGRKLHSWLSACLKHGFRRMAEQRLMEKEVSVLFSSSCPQITAIVTCMEDKEDEQSTPLTLRIFPVIQLGGVGPSASMQHPLPMQMPLAKDGAKVLQRVKQKLDRGSLNITAALPLATGGGKLDTPVMPGRKSRGRKSNEEDDKPRIFWKLSFSEIENELYAQTLKLDCMNVAMEAMDIFQAVKKKRGDKWDVINDDVSQTVLLWVMKKAGHQLSTLSEWFVTYLDTLKGVVASRACPGFLQPKDNVFPQESNGDIAKAVAADIGNLLNDLEEKRKQYES